jgi:hypothetical protein
MLHRRVVEAVIWGSPAVNFDRMYLAGLRVTNHCLGCAVDADGRLYEISPPQ